MKQKFCIALHFSCALLSLLARVTAEGRHRLQILGIVVEEDQIDLVEDCAPFQSQLCDVLPLYDSNGKIMYNYLQENCIFHECVQISPEDNTQSYIDPLNGNVKNVPPWFCNTTIMPQQKTRVEKDTGWPPGKKEDFFAGMYILKKIVLDGFVVSNETLSRDNYGIVCVDFLGYLLKLS